MIQLCSDWLIATQQVMVRILRGDFGNPIVRRFQRFPPSVDRGVPPTGAGDLPVSAAGPGGHPRPTSELLRVSVSFVDNYRMNNPNALSALDDFMAELRDRAAEFQAIGD